MYTHKQIDFINTDPVQLYIHRFVWTVSPQRGQQISSYQPSQSCDSILRWERSICIKSEATLAKRHHLNMWRVSLYVFPDPEKHPGIPNYHLYTHPGLALAPAPQAMAPAETHAQGAWGRHCLQRGLGGSARRHGDGGSPQGDPGRREGSPMQGLHSGQGVLAGSLYK